jgi:hypothetical protein
MIGDWDYNGTGFSRPTQRSEIERKFGYWEYAYDRHEAVEEDTIPGSFVIIRQHPSESKTARMNALFVCLF